MMIAIPEKRTQGTRAFYERKYQQLATQAGEKFGLQKGVVVPPNLILQHLLARRSTLSKRTWQVYKSAFVAQMESFAAQTKDPAESQVFLQMAYEMGKEGQSEARPRGVQGASLKGRRVRQEDHQRLIQYLIGRFADDKWAKVTKLVCEASYLTGLRPGEWVDAWVEHEGGTGPLLSVRNAKQTHGRGNGERRTLDLSALSPDEVGLIEEMTLYARGSEEPWSQVQRKVADYLYASVQKAFGRRKCYLSLYSYRHQFSADAKATWKKAEVAALMGHGSDETAGRNYARALVGTRGRSRVKPVAAEVARVRQVAKPRPPKPKAQ